LEVNISILRLFVFVSFIDFIAHYTSGHITLDIKRKRDKDAKRSVNIVYSTLLCYDLSLKQLYFWTEDAFIIIHVCKLVWSYLWWQRLEEV